MIDKQRAKYFYPALQRQNNKVKSLKLKKKKKKKNSLKVWGKDPDTNRRTNLLLYLYQIALSFVLMDSTAVYGNLRIMRLSASVWKLLTAPKLPRISSTEFKS